MCESCSHEPGSGAKRWTIMHLIVLMLVVTLVGLSVAGLTLRFRGSNNGATSGCAHVGVDSTAYQAALTSHLQEGPSVLLSDTSAFVRHVHGDRTSDCAALRSFAVGTRSTLRSICAPCAERIRRAFGDT